MKTPAAKRKSAGPTSASSRTKTTTIDVTPGSKKGGDNMATVMFNSVMGGRSALKVCVCRKIRFSSWFDTILIYMYIHDCIVATIQN